MRISLYLGFYFSLEILKEIHIYSIMLSEEMGSMKIITVSVGETGEHIVLCVYGSGSWLAHCRMEVQ